MNNCGNNIEDYAADKYSLGARVRVIDVSIEIYTSRVKDRERGEHVWDGSIIRYCIITFFI